MHIPFQPVVEKWGSVPDRMASNNHWFVWEVYRKLIRDLIPSSVTQLSRCSLAAAYFASLSVFSFPGMPQ